MIYLDYSATTKPDAKVLETFNKVSTNYFGNPNSLHKLGKEARDIINESTNIICQYFKIKNNELIYTSGATESNNLAIKGVIAAYPYRSKKIISTKLEHSSITSQLERLKDEGFDIEYVKLTQDGIVDLNNLKELLKEDPLLVSICMIDSEIGIRQPIEEIGKIIKEYPKTIFHTDITQALGKVDFDLKDVDLASFSAHKIYGIKGIGGLIKKESINLKPLIEGGTSTTIYRSGTPATSLIASCAKAFKIIEIDNEPIKNYQNKILIELSKYENIHINSTNQSIPHIINFSIKGIKPETFIHLLETKDVYISSKTACSSNKDISQSVLALTNNEVLSKSTFRISISRYTTEKEVNDFIEIFKECYTRIESLIK